jgi:hypothetical protein
MLTWPTANLGAMLPEKGPELGCKNCHRRGHCALNLQVTCILRGSRSLPLQSPKSPPCASKVDAECDLLDLSSEENEGSERELDWLCSKKWTGYYFPFQSLTSPDYPRQRFKSPYVLTELFSRAANPRNCRPKRLLQLRTSRAMTIDSTFPLVKSWLRNWTRE